MQGDPAAGNGGGGRRRPARIELLAAVLGLALFVYFIRRAGVGAVADGIARLGWAFLAVVALGGVRFGLRAAAWIRCLEPGHRLRLRDAFPAVVAGDALGNLTPLSLIVGEPTKAILLRRREPPGRTLPALAVENLFYALSALLVIAGGMAALLVVLGTPGRLWLAASVATLAVGTLVAGAHWVVWRNVRIGSAALAWLRRHGVAPALAARAAVRVRAMEDHVHARYPRDLRRLLAVAALELAFHACAVLEIFLVLSLIVPQRPTLLDAFVFEATNRFITAAFRFVPLRIGVDEAGTGLFADLLAFGTAAGVTLALVRKGRMLVWTAVGTAVAAGRGLSPRRAIAAGGSRAAIVIMARSPAGGDAPKTRLAGAVPRESDRRRLCAAFLRDLVATCRTVEGATLRLVYTPDGGAAGLTALGVGDEELLPQRGADLGARERAAFADLFAAGFDKVALVGSDLPTLPAGHLRRALDAAAPGTVVLGPSDDGGYYLMALAAAPGKPVPDLFTGVRWSTPSAFEDTEAAARRAGLRVALVPRWRDVDDAEGLANLRTELAGAAGSARAPATAEALAKIFGQEDGPT